jgi:branched-chain amino acid transport system substrate-binding protein
MTRRYREQTRRFRQPARRGIVIVLSLLMVATTAVVFGTSLPSSAASSAPPTGGGNASGGSLATTANKQTLIGPKGSGLTAGITSTSIKVGCIYTSGNYSGYIDGIKARFAQANKKGIDGRTLTLVPCLDDTGGVQSNVQETQQLVNQDQVFSVLSLTEYMLNGSTNYLTAHQVPYIGWGFNPGFCGYRWGFGWNGCLSPILLPTSSPLHNVVAGSLGEAMIQASGMPASSIRFAVQAENSPSGTSGNAQYVALFKKLGAKVVYNQANFPTTSTGVDYTPYVQAIVAAKPNLVYISTPFADVAPLAAALKAGGYTGTIMDFVTYSPGLLASSPQLASALQGEYTNTQVVPQEGGGAWVSQEEAALRAIGDPPFLTLGASMGYAEANVLVEMLQAVGKNLNTKTFDQKVNGGSFVSYKTAPSGSPGKLLWPAAHFIPADCAAVVKVSGTTYTTSEPFKCYSSYNIPG